MAKKKINGLPVFEARMTNENCGVLRVSFVDSPAVESDFVAYGEAAPAPREYAITDEDKRRVFGCVLRADYPIYRRDENGEYYIVFRADEIRAFAQKYLAEGRQNEVDLEHDFKSIEGAEMVQYFIKDTAKGIAPEGYDDVADGSLFAEYQITDDDLWERIKSGEFHGFSVEIIHAVLPADYSKHISDMKNTIMARVKEALAKAVEEVESEFAEAPEAVTEAATSEPEEKKYGAVSSDKGAIFWEGEGELEVGAIVWGETEDGEKIDLEDGEYVIEGGVIVIEGGKVAEIKDAPVAEPEAEAPEAEADAEAEAAAEDEPAAEPEAEPEPAEDIDALKARIAELEAAVAEKDAEIEDLKAKLAAPAAESAHDAFKKASKPAANPFEIAAKYRK